MEPEGSLPCSQKPATGAYPELAEFSLPHRSLSPKVMSYFLCLGRAKIFVQVRGSLKHFVTRKFFTVRSC
jgi:hypothetical protein